MKTMLIESYSPIDMGFDIAGVYGFRMIEDGMVILSRGEVSLRSTTNKMCLQALIDGLKEIKDDSEVVIYSHRKYVVDAYNKDFKKVKANKEQIDLIKSLRKPTVRVEWIHGQTPKMLDFIKDLKISYNMNVLGVKNNAEVF